MEYLLEETCCRFGKERYFRGAKGDYERRRSWARQSSRA